MTEEFCRLAKLPEVKAIATVEVVRLEKIGLQCYGVLEADLRFLVVACCV